MFISAGFRQRSEGSEGRRDPALQFGQPEPERGRQQRGAAGDGPLLSSPGQLCDIQVTTRLTLNISTSTHLHFLLQSPHSLGSPGQDPGEELLRPDQRPPPPPHQSPAGVREGGRL